MLEKIIQNLFATNNLIRFRTPNENWDEFIIGFIVEMGDSYFIVNEIDEYGIPIGNTLFKMNNIKYVKKNDEYMSDLKLLYQNHKKLDRNKRITIWDNQEAFTKAIGSLKESKAIVTLFLTEDDDNYVIGRILDFDINTILIQNIERNGKLDGISCYQKEDIEGIRYGGIKEQAIGILESLK